MQHRADSPYDGLAMRICCFLLTLGLFVCSTFAQSVWVIPKRVGDVLVDGNLQEWEGVPALDLSPTATGIQKGGTFHDQDLDVRVQAMWDEDDLFVALTWIDDVWDVREVTRRDAVWIDSDKKRRDRMYFFDYLKFHLRDAEYDYTLWVSPRDGDEGPFSWCRLLEGYRGLERATMSPTFSAQQSGDKTTIEFLLSWSDLRLKRDQLGKVPLTLIVSDSDHPGKLIEAKLEDVKWLAWRGMVQLQGLK